MKMRGDSYLLIGIMTFALAFGLMSLTYPDLKTKLVPATVSVIVFVLAGIQLGKELSQKEQPDKESKTNVIDETLPVSVFGWREDLVAFAWMLGFTGAIYLVGFHFSTLLLILSFMKLNRLGWLKSIFTAVLTTATIYVVFVAVLQADLYTGVITQAILARF
jgi:uncharacterized membrane protein